jgi:hypothetical protein
MVIFSAADLTSSNSTCQSIIQSNRQTLSVNQSINQLHRHTPRVNQSITCTVTFHLSINQSITPSHSICQLINQPINRTINSSLLRVLRPTIYLKIKQFIEVRITRAFLDFGLLISTFIWQQIQPVRKRQYCTSLITLNLSLTFFVVRSMATTILI